MYNRCVESGLKSTTQRELFSTYTKDIPSIPQIELNVKYFIFQKGLDKPCATWYNGCVKWNKVYSNE